MGATAALTNLFLALLNGIAASANVLFARYMGAAQEHSVKQLVSSSFISSISIGVLFAAGGNAFNLSIARANQLP